MFAVACENAFVEEAQFIPVAGRWAKVGEDGLVSFYVEFENGVYSGYNAKSLVAYFEGALWGCSDAHFERITQEQYSIVGNDLILSGRHTSIALASPTTLYINNIRYEKITSFNDEYYRQIDVDEEVSIDYSAEYVTIPCEISNADKDVEIDIKCDADWVKSVTYQKGELLIRCSQNNSALKRYAFVTLSYAGAENKTIYIVQTGNRVSPDNAIVYTTSDNAMITTISSSAFDATISSHTYEDGVGVIVFDGPITEIKAGAFKFQETLKTITIPDSVTTIGIGVVVGCTSLESVYGKFASSDNRCLIIDGYLTIFAPAGLTSYTIPDTVTTIGELAFYNCTSLTSITIPDSVTTIGEGAFYNCTSLTSVTIGNSVTTIGDFAFEECESLTSVIIGDGVTSIGRYAFVYCESLTSVTIGDSVTTIGDSAFAYCISLTSITIPDSVTTIGEWAFYNCDSLTSITIPDGVTTIGDYAFCSCNSLTSITIPDGVTTIGDCAFCSCDSLTSITIPDGVTTIGDSAFIFCTSLTSITIPDGVTTIGDSAFEYCDSLTSITIPDSVTTIGDYAFHGCDSLISVYCKPTIPPTMVLSSVNTETEAFDNNASNRKIYVPRASVSKYKSADGWSKYADAIVGYDF